jgi:hypothetical protein
MQRSKKASLCIFFMAALRIAIWYLLVMNERRFHASLLSRSGLSHRPDPAGFFVALWLEMAGLSLMRPNK